jgi:hypothetical protein
MLIAFPSVMVLVLLEDSMRIGTPETFTYTVSVTVVCGYKGTAF